MKKLIILFLILGILVMGCSKNQAYSQPAPQQSPAIGSGCSVSESENKNQEMAKVKYVRVQAGL